MSKLGEMTRRVFLAPVRLLVPQRGWKRWLMIALPIVLLLWFLEPAVSVLLKLLELLQRVLQPLLETTFGRVLLMLLVTALLLALAAVLLRSRIRRFRSQLALGRHLQATAALLDENVTQSRLQFQRLARYRGPLPDEYEALCQDAALKAARLSLQQGDVDGAQAWLLRVVETRLPPELLRSLLQLRVRVYREQGALLPETMEAEVRAAVKRFGDDYTLQGELRDLLRAQGRLDELLAVQEKVLKLAPPSREAGERQVLALDLIAAGEAAIARGEFDVAKRCAKKLKSVDRDGPSSGLLLGKVQAAAGDCRSAIREWGAVRSPEGLDLIAALLQERPGVIEPRELLECCPMQGTLLLVARELARRGEHDMAERAARAAAAALGPTPSVCAVLVQVLELLGKPQQAALLTEQAVQRLVAPRPVAE